jgi:hypothetical protein
MNVFSAADAIAPAISRTNRFLFHPFRLGTFLKLSLVAVITEGMSGNHTTVRPRMAGHREQCRH